MSTLPQDNSPVQDWNYLRDNWRQIVKKYQVPNNGKAIWQMLSSFLPFLGLWVLMYFSLNISYWLTLGLGLLNAFFVVRIFIIQHDCGHQSYFASKKLNDAIGFVCSIFSLIPYTYWSKSHAFHHGNNGRLEEDARDIGDIPLYTVEEFKVLSPFKRFLYQVYRNPVVLFGFSSLYYILIHNRLPFIKKNGWAGARKSLIWSNLTMIIVYALLIWGIGWKNILLIQSPIMAFFGIIAIWFFYVQHQHEFAYKQWKKNWDFLTSAIKGSTYYKLPRPFQWLTGNIGIHHIHHLSSLIPSYELPRCRDENPIFQKYVTIVSFWESLSFMSHKLWDEGQQKMISFREFYRREKLGLA